MKREGRRVRKNHPQARSVVIFLSVFLALLTRVEGCVLLTPDEVRLAAAMQPHRPSVYLYFLPQENWSRCYIALGCLFFPQLMVECVFCFASVSVCVWSSVLKSRRKKKEKNEKVVESFECYTELSIYFILFHYADYSDCLSICLSLD